VGASEAAEVFVYGGLDAKIASPGLVGGSGFRLSKIRRSTCDPSALDRITKHNRKPHPVNFRQLSIAIGALGRTKKGRVVPWQRKTREDKKIQANQQLEALKRAQPNAAAAFFGIP